MGRCGENFGYDESAFFLLQEEVPPGIYYAHYKNVEKTAVAGKFDPNAGLSISGIAGTGSDKEEEDKTVADDEMKNGKWFSLQFFV